jgi:hypothetical protein
MRYRELLESLPHPTQLGNVDAMITFLFNNIEWDGVEGESLLHQYNKSLNDDYDEDDYDEDDASQNLHNIDIESPEFKKWFKNWAEDSIWEVWGNFEHLFDAQGNAILYRVITADPNWTPERDGRHPGVYWSWDKDSAEAHWGDYSNGQVAFRMTAKINSSNIDWVTTFGMNAQPSYEEEREIRIQENAPVEILKTERLK